MLLEQLKTDDEDRQLYQELLSQGAQVDQQVAAFEAKVAAMNARFAGDVARLAEIQFKKDALIAKLRATFGI